MELNALYDVEATATFIHTRGFKRVALQFPDELLKDSVKVVRALKTQLQQNSYDGVQMYVMADTTYGSCCVDEVAAAHVNADCVVHYGHACFSPTSNLPAWFVFRKSSFQYKNCIDALLKYSCSVDKPLLVLFSLEYIYASALLKGEVEVYLKRDGMSNKIIFAELVSSEMDPSSLAVNNTLSKDDTFVYQLGALKWVLHKDKKMEDYMIVWIGSESVALTNVLLTYSSCELVRYDPENSVLLKDISNQERILKRRYYLVQRAKDADIVGIVIGTLGIAGYQKVICTLKNLIKGAGKKPYSFVMGRPNPAKLANFPECNMFIYIACPETAMLDSKEFLSPVITPYEAILAFSRGSEWTNSYSLSFSDILGSSEKEVNDVDTEPHFSFIKGAYVANDTLSDDVDEKEEKAIALANEAKKALRLRDDSSNTGCFNITAKSGAEFLTLRSYQGLEISKETKQSYTSIKGRSGRAWSYQDEGHK